MIKMCAAATPSYQWRHHRTRHKVVDDNELEAEIADNVRFASCAR